MESALLASSAIEWKQVRRFGTEKFWPGSERWIPGIGGIGNRSGGSGLQILPEHFLGTLAQLRDPFEVGNAAG
jgi:hypothetical protein